MNITRAGLGLVLVLALPARGPRHQAPFAMNRLRACSAPGRAESAVGARIAAGLASGRWRQQTLRHRYPEMPVVRLPRFILALAASALALQVDARAVEAQASPADPLCAYRDCALRVEGARLVRGAAGETVATPGFFRPMHLAPHVVGDSALAYAVRHDRAATRAAWLSNGGGLAMLAGLAVALIRDRGCDPSDFRSCRDGDALYLASAGLVLGGAVATFAGVPFARSAWRLQARAVWWNNARFAR